MDIETDKAAMEVESPASGTVRDLVEENVDVAIGEPVAFMYADSESITLPAGTPARQRSSAARSIRNHRSASERHHRDRRNDTLWR